MVKLVNTPFGNYGYVLSQRRGEPRHKSFQIPLMTPKLIARDFHGSLTTYDAKQLRTTQLAKGSNITKVHDPLSYTKRGLLHVGQAPATPLESQFPLPLQSYTSRERSSDTKENETSQSRNESSKIAVKLPPNFARRNQEVSKRHAGKSTLSRQHPGFAKGYAAYRADLGCLASTLGSGSEDSPRFQEADDDEENSRKARREVITSHQLTRIDPQEMPFTALGRLKSKRLHDVYSDMFRKQEENRKRLIMKRIKTTEEIKERMLKMEIEEQRDLMKCSSSNQRNQLREVRNRHSKDHDTRFHSIYSKPHASAPHQSVPPLPTLGLANTAPPREVYGLPEDESSPRSDTTRNKHIFKVSPGRFSLESYLTARKNLALNFNNVWNKISTLPRTPRTDVKA
ncbi:unnamed protein product [Clavelina lepadiformis]|uniref:Uncharacterized protein n=1 Tax=Clavelina lepadiformis TaxID=159417 RepID=A0ABP0GIJ2_CLALP